MKNSNQRNTAILFTRIPHAGTTKTRLMPFLSAEECVQLHYAFMADEIAEISKVSDMMVVSYFEDENTTDDDRDEFRSFLMQEVSIHFLTKQQHGRDIFNRMRNAFADADEEVGEGKKILVGCDLPLLYSKDLSEAFSALENSDVVINPTEDGGYCLIGMKKCQTCPFEVEGDGASTVLDDTINRCGGANLSINVGGKLTDIDTPQDLYELFERKEELASNSLTRLFLEHLDKSRFEVAGFLGKKVSVIIPVYNEESTIKDLVNNLTEVQEKAEIIFVDGGSTDSTISILMENMPKNGRLIKSKKGRAHQMNEGAKTARGAALMFLHADSTPPKNMIEEIRRVLAQTNWGCFGVKFDDPDPLMKICQIISNNRIRDRKVVFGDQGIFIKKELFEEVGGFPEIPIMEDYQFSLTLKDRGEKIGVGKGLMTTSARRYKQGGKLKVMWKMNRLRKAYRDGVPIEEISAAYADIR